MSITYFSAPSIPAEQLVAAALGRGVWAPPPNMHYVPFTQLRVAVDRYGLLRLTVVPTTLGLGRISLTAPLSTERYSIPEMLSTFAAGNEFGVDVSLQGSILVNAT